MSTERDEIEKQLAGELGFSVVNPKVAGIGHVPEFVEGDGESDTDYIADGRHWALFDALVAERLKLAEVERERDEFFKSAVAVLNEEPIDGEYLHLLTCSGSRKFPPGLPGHSCSCPVGRARAESASLKLAAADRVIEAAENACFLAEQSPSFELISDGMAALRSALLEYQNTKV